MLLISTTLLMLSRAVIGSPNGAPASACGSMTPGHGVTAQPSNTFPYTISSSTTAYRCGEQITVTLSSNSGTQFRGFLCQARTDAANADTKVGTLAPAGSVTMKQNCGAGWALTHSENGDKSSVQFTWQPSANHGTVKIVCSVVQSKLTFWVRETSSELAYGGGCEANPTTTPSSAGHLTMSAGIVLLAIMINLLK